MSKKKLFSGIVVTGFFLVLVGSGSAFAGTSDAGVNQDQSQHDDGYSGVYEHSGLTFQYGDQQQEAGGYAVGQGSNISSQQSQDQWHQYNDYNGDADNWAGHESDVYASSAMSGEAKNYGLYGMESSQVYNGYVDTANSGPVFAESSSYDGFGQNTQGLSFGNSGTENELNVDGHKSYAQLTSSPDGDFAYHTGSSDFSSDLYGSTSPSFVSGYHGSVDGDSSSNTVTTQSGDARYQASMQNSDAHLTGTGANVAYVADMNRTDSYEQLSVGPNGWQQQQGEVSTHVDISHGTIPTAPQP